MTPATYAPGFYIEVPVNGTTRKEFRRLPRRHDTSNEAMEHALWGKDREFEILINTAYWRVAEEPEG